MFEFPDAFKHAVNSVFTGTRGAITYLSLSVLVLASFIRWRTFFTRTWVGVVALVAASLFLVASYPDHNFYEIAGKPDNVPIMGLIFLVGFFTWLAFRRMVENDRRVAASRPTLEEEESRDKVLVWPDLVYIEFIALILCTVLFIVWSVGIGAPLEQPANFTKTPNPSKAPWYFLGLQEMLVYFDPWLAGVVFPGLIIVGLMAIPYFDPNPRGNGYYTFRERPFAIVVFCFGFIVMWVVLIVMGTFLRGPNWNFFGPYEYWDPHKLEPLLNVNLSEYFWVKGYPLSMGLPEGYLLREAPGLALLAAYFLLGPLLLARSFFRRFLEQMGMARYQVMCFLFLMMALLPLKMILRWSINLKYFVAIPEKFFNI